MESPPDRSQSHQERRPGDQLSAQTVHELRRSLTVIKAQAQMLRRWVQRAAPPEGDAALARLAVIDEMTTQLAADIARLHHPDEPDATTDMATADE